MGSFVPGMGVGWRSLLQLAGQVGFFGWDLRAEVWQEYSGHSSRRAKALRQERAWVLGKQQQKTASVAGGKAQSSVWLEVMSGQWARAGR